MPKANQEIVIIIEQDGKPFMMVRKNGSIEYYTLKKANWADHVNLHGAENAEKQNG